MKFLINLNQMLDKMQQIGAPIIYTIQRMISNSKSFSYVHSSLPSLGFVVGQLVPWMFSLHRSLYLRNRNIPADTSMPMWPMHRRSPRYEAISRQIALIRPTMIQPKLQKMKIMRIPLPSMMWDQPVPASIHSLLQSAFRSSIKSKTFSASAHFLLRMRAPMPASRLSGSRNVFMVFTASVLQWMS